MKNTRTSFFKSLLLIGLLLTLSSLPTVQAATDCAAVTEIPKAQCDTLVALYNSTGGANWTNKAGWNETNTPCSWYGITCGGNIIKVDMGNNNLKGSLPDLSALTGLQILFLSQNQLTGTIPDLSKLTSLQSLLLQKNQLTGAIPDLSRLTNLQFLVLTDNQLTGTIPDLSQLTNLQSLGLFGNPLTGTIPDLSQLTNLRSLSLGRNQLTGAIPDLSQLTNLQSLQLSWNQLTGAIPDLSQLTNLRFLDLSWNQLTGTIPDLSKLTSLQTLSLRWNQLTGTIPDLSKLTNLQFLMLWNNQLTGTIPDLSKLTSLQFLELINNQLTGAIPDLSQLTSLRELSLSGNQLTGIIPDLSKLTSLQRLGLVNQLTGSIPDLSQLTKLTELDMSGNQLSGPIPSLNSLTKLTTLNLFNNPQLCKDPNANYGTRTEVNAFPLCDSTLSLTVTKTGTGTGDVKINVTEEIDCGTICTSGFLATSSVTLIATPATGSVFTGWSGACTGTTAYTTVIMNAAKTCVADFIPFSCNNVTEIPKAQCDTLVALYDNTGGDNWTDNTSWKKTNTPCSWYGISCSGGNVTGISLAGFSHLKGTLPDLSALTSLQRLELNCSPPEYHGNDPDCNNLTGAIPDLSKLSSLEYLGLKGNQFTGTIPDLSKLTNLEFLFLSDNQLTGTIPDLSKLTNLWYISLSSNQLTGAIPDLSKLTNLGYLSLSGGNQLCKDPNANYGGHTEVDSFPICASPLVTETQPDTSVCAQVTQIPSDQCQTLLTLYNTTNGPTWTHQDGWNTTSTPCQWYGVECTNGQVTALRLNDNNLKGILPVLPTSLETFIADGNQLSGPLTPVSTLTSLRTLSLSNNQLGDALPDLGQLTQLELLNLNNNQLVGPIPDLRKLTQLKQLLLKDNHLAGAIPALTVAETLDLSGNDQLCRDSNLTYTQPELNTYPPCSYPTLTVAKTGSGIGLVSATSPTDKDKLTCGQECTGTNQVFTPDSTVTLTATPTDGTVFTGWLGECNGDTATTTVTLDQAKTCVANFEIKAGYYELQVSKAGIGKGLITSSNKDDPLHCDAKCQETRKSYPAGTAVTLRAEAGKGSTFTGWGGACSGTDKRLTITLDQAQSCFATFNLKEPPPPTMRQLIINTDAGSGNGTVTAIGIDCGIDCLENYREGINVKLTATPHAGSSFLGWEDDCGGKDPTLTVKMTDNKLCTAFFANDVEMVASETVTDFYANGYLDTGEEVKDRYPRYPDNDQRLQEAFSLAQPAILTVDLQVDVNDLDATWPIQFNDGISFFRLQPAGRYTESVKILKDAIVEGYLSPALVVGYYVEVRVKLLNYLGGEEWVPILTYYGDTPTIEEVTGAKRAERGFLPTILSKAGIAIKPPPPPCGSACRRPPRG